MQIPWESDLAQLLESLSQVQEELLKLLNEKRQLLVRADMQALAALEPRERELLERLEECHAQRQSLLARAEQEGLPSDSIRSLSTAVGGDASRPLASQIHEAQARSRLLHHHSLTNWVLVQRTLIHLSQMLEIIATGGRARPTYEKGKSAAVSGSLMDHAV
ncbi:MAG: flagellar export chaperone FlgN [Pirellulales bacterium]